MQTDNDDVAPRSKNSMRQREPGQQSAVKDHFRAYKRALIRVVGRGPMFEDKIDEIGKSEFGKKWSGVFASDQAGRLLSMRDRYAVINTATSKGPGAHWLGFYITAKGVAYEYDSFGRSLRRVNWRLSREAVEDGVELRGTDPAHEQRGFSALCGQLSLSWLLTVRDLGIKATAMAV